MTAQEWVANALDAAVEQGFAVEITDGATLDFIADVMLSEEAASAGDAA